MIHRRALLTGLIAGPLIARIPNVLMRVSPQDNRAAIMDLLASRMAEADALMHKHYERVLYGMTDMFQTYSGFAFPFNEIAEGFDINGYS